MAATLLQFWQSFAGPADRTFWVGWSDDDLTAPCTWTGDLSSLMLADLGRALGSAPLNAAMQVIVCGGCMHTELVLLLLCGCMCQVLQSPAQARRQMCCRWLHGRWLHGLVSVQNACM